MVQSYSSLIDVPIFLSQVQWNAWGSIALPLLIWPLIFFQLTFKSADAESSLCQDFKRTVKAYLTILTCGKWNKEGDYEEVRGNTGQF